MRWKKNSTVCMVQGPAEYVNVGEVEWEKDFGATM